MALRVLLVNDFPDGHPSAGGCERVVAETARLLAAHGAATDLFTADDVPGFRRTVTGYVASARCRRALAARVRAWRPDVVHFHNVYHRLTPAVLGVGAERPGVRTVLTAHDFHLVCPSPACAVIRRGRWHPVDPATAGRPAFPPRRWDPRGAAHSWLRSAQHAWSYRGRDRRTGIDLVLCPSRTMERAMAHAGRPTRFVPYPAEPPVAPVPRPDDGLALVFAGRVAPEKGLDVFLEAVPDAGSWRLEVVGDGPALARCRAVCRRRDLDRRVTFAGRLPHAETTARIARAHVLVLPSLWYENAPLVLAEALARRTSLLVSDLGGMREIVDEAGVGRAVRPGDAAGLVAALAALEDRRREGTLNAFDPARYLDERSPARYVERLLDAYGVGGTAAVIDGSSEGSPSPCAS